MYRQQQKHDQEAHGSPIALLEHGINIRKIGWDTIFIAHNEEMIDRQIRFLGGSVVRVVNYARIKLPVVGIPISQKPKFRAKELFGQGEQGRKATWSQVEFYGLDLRIARHYKSQQRFDASAGASGAGLRFQFPSGSISQHSRTLASLEVQRQERARRAALHAALGPLVPMLRSVDDETGVVGEAVLVAPPECATECTDDAAPRSLWGTADELAGYRP